MNTLIVVTMLRTVQPNKAHLPDAIYTNATINFLLSTRSDNLGDY